MPRLLLIFSSLFNTGLLFLVFNFMAFATSPRTDDVSMRIAFYVSWPIMAVAIVGIIAPWILAAKKRRKSALLLSLLPVILVCSTIILFLLLDSWLSRTFG